MVEYTFTLDVVFGSLADPTRRDILSRIIDSELTVGELANRYDMSFAAVSKHLKVLEGARLIIKRRSGKRQMISLAPGAFADAQEYLSQYKQQMEDRFNQLDKYLVDNS